MRIKGEGWRGSSETKRAILVLPRHLVDHLDEALILAETAGYEVVSIVKTRYPRRVGRGLLERLKSEIETLAAETVIFYGDPQPSTVFQIMKEAGVKVVDRVMLILEIFALHAGSREAKLQIEAARIKHEMPLIREMIRRSKMRELPGFLGPGGYAVDSYYRHLTRRLAKIRRELEEQRRIRGQRRKSRSRQGIYHVSIVGYASAGKTSIFNRLTGEKRRTGEEYFTTLYPKHKAISVGGVRVALADTVGFIRDVPPEVIEAFYSTLEDIAESDAIIFVIDASEDPRTVREKFVAGLDILARIGANGIPLIVALNKADKADDVQGKTSIISGEANRYPWPISGVIAVSALTGDGLDDLVNLIVEVLAGGEAGRSLQEGVRAQARAQAGEG